MIGRVTGESAQMNLVSGRKIWLGRAPADGGRFVNVVYVGQEAFEMEFGV